MKEMRLPRAVFRYIEHELHSYESTRQEYELEREAILHGTPQGEEATGGKKRASGDTTANKAVQLSSNAQILKMWRTLKAIDGALEMLGEEHNQIFVLKYQENRHWKEIVEEVPLSDRDYFRKRLELVFTVAVQLGYANP